MLTVIGAARLGAVKRVSLVSKLLRNGLRLLTFEKELVVRARDRKVGLCVVVCINCVLVSGNLGV